MQLLTENTIQIIRPIEVVYCYTSDLENFGKWFPGVLAIESANEFVPAATGKQYLETVAIPMRGPHQVRITVVDAKPYDFLATEGELPPLMPRMEIQFQSIDSSSCTVTWRMFSRNSSMLARLTFLPLVRRIMRKRAANGLETLKKRLENSSF